MTETAARLDRVFIDTSELFPFTLMDVMLGLSEDLLFTWVWTDELLEEWEHVIVEHGQRSPSSAASVTKAVRTYFGAYRIPTDIYQHRVTDDLSPDPADRVHAAACLYGNVQVLLTRNTKHLSSPRLSQAGVEVMNADQYLCRLFKRHPEAVTESFGRTTASKSNPPIAMEEMAERVHRAGAPKFAGLIHSQRSTNHRPA